MLANEYILEPSLANDMRNKWQKSWADCQLTESMQFVKKARGILCLKSFFISLALKNKFFQVF